MLQGMNEIPAELKKAKANDTENYRATGKTGLLVKRRNDLLFGKHNMSVQEMRLFLWLVAQVRMEDEELKTYRLGVREFQELVGIEGGNQYGQMIETIKRLMSRVVQVNDFDEKVLRHRPLLSEADYRYGEGYVELKLHPYLKPYVLKLSGRFTQIELDIALRLKSAYSMRLYELLKAEEFKGGTAPFVLEELRKLLGVEVDQYDRFDNFKARVLEPAKKELTDRTDLVVDYTVERSGRAIGKVIFKAHSRGRMMGFAAGTRKDKLFRRLRAVDMPEDEAMQAIADWADDDPGRIEFHLEECRSKRIPLAWLRAGLREDYRPRRSLLAEVAEMKKKAAETRADYTPQSKVSGLEEPLKQAFENLYGEIGGGGK